MTPPETRTVSSDASDPWVAALIDWLARMQRRAWEREARETRKAG